MNYKIVRIKACHVEKNKNLSCNDINKFAVKFNNSILYIAKNLTTAERVLEELKELG